MWIALVDELDGKVTNLVLRVAPYADIVHTSHVMVSELRRIVELSPCAVADTYLQMLTRFAPTYRQEDIEETIEALYRSGGAARTKANQICDRYIQYGVKFPAEIRARFARS